MTTAHHIADTPNAAKLRGVVRVVVAMAMSSDGDLRISALTR